eukprot:ANDGO_06540.mRNA.1 hypothetical protein
MKAVGGYVLLLCLLVVLRPLLTSSPPLTLLTGFLSSFLYVFGLAFITDLGNRLGRKHQGFTDLGAAWGLFAVGALMIHPVCITVGTVGAVVQVYYTSSVAAELGSNKKL